MIDVPDFAFEGVVLFFQSFTAAANVNKGVEETQDNGNRGE